MIRAIGVSHTACKDEFRQNPRSHSWKLFSFLYCGYWYFTNGYRPGYRFFFPPLLLPFLSFFWVPLGAVEEMMLVWTPPSKNKCSQVEDRPGSNVPDSRPSSSLCIRNPVWGAAPTLAGWCHMLRCFVFVFGTGATVTTAVLIDTTIPSRHTTTPVVTNNAQVMDHAAMLLLLR